MKLYQVWEVWCYLFLVITYILVRLTNLNSNEYSAEIYTIIKVNKNTVDIENDEVELDGVKKTDIIIIKESYNNRSIDHIQKVEKEHKTERILKSDGIDKSNILSYKHR